MKQLVGLLMLLFAFMLSGCGDNEIAYVTDDDLLTKNNIMDVVSVFERESVEENTSIIYYGYRKGREWFALFDAKSGLLKEEWYGKEWFFEGIANMPSDIRPHLFEKLENNEYVFTYYSQSENAELLVFLSDGKSVRYELGSGCQRKTDCPPESLLESCTFPDTGRRFNSVLQNRIKCRRLDRLAGSFKRRWENLVQTRSLAGRISRSYQEQTGIHQRSHHLPVKQRGQRGMAYSF